MPKPQYPTNEGIWSKGKGGLTPVCEMLKDKK